MTPECNYRIMRNKYGLNDTYDSHLPKPGWLAKNFPTPYFYFSIAAGPVQWLLRKAAHNEWDECIWVHGSAWFADKMEECGIPIQIEGLNNILKLDRPCVIIANHMSTLETFLLPSIIRPHRPLTFVVKKSLIKMPLFGAVMRACDPIVVGRVNPKEDLAQVLEGGKQRLEKGISIVVFPQSTRTLEVEATKFSSIGVKLARHLNVPVLPLALKTDAWGQGKKIKEAGRIRPDLPARFKFGTPVHITGNGKKEHADICDFICKTVNNWKNKDGVNQ